MLNETKFIQPRFSSPGIEGNYQVSKWLHFQLLLSKEEMEEFLEVEKDLLLYPASDICEIGKPLIKKDEFLKAYAHYLDVLLEGEGDFSQFRRMFSCFGTVSPECLYSVEVSEDEQLIRPCTPVIQFRPHQLGFSKVDRTFFPMAFGSSSISWGLQISYPQVFQNPKNQEIIKIDKSPLFPNTAAFKNLSRWIRLHTEPAIFNVEETRVVTTVRIGKQALAFVDKHPQLVALNLGMINENRAFSHRG